MPFKGFTVIIRPRTQSFVSGFQRNKEGQIFYHNDDILHFVIIAIVGFASKKYSGFLHEDWLYFRPEKLAGGRIHV